MTWWEDLAQVGLVGFAVGIVGAVATVVRLLPWGKGWSVGGYP